VAMFAVAQAYALMALLRNFDDLCSSLAAFYYVGWPMEVEFSSWDWKGTRWGLCRL
jgi:hypothetical protein